MDELNQRDLSISSAFCSALASVQMLGFVRKGYGRVTIGTSEARCGFKELCAHARFRRALTNTVQKQVQKHSREGASFSCLSCSAIEWNKDG